MRQPTRINRGCLLLFLFFWVKDWISKPCLYLGRVSVVGLNTVPLINCVKRSRCPGFLTLVQLVTPVVSGTCVQNALQVTLHEILSTETAMVKVDSRQVGELIVERYLKYGVKFEVIFIIFNVIKCNY